MERLNKSWLDKGLIYKLRVCLYCGLLFIYFYAVDGKLNVAVKYVMNCAVFAWAFLEFVLVPDTKKAWYLVKVFFIFMTPFLMFELYSLAIWIKDLRSVDYIIRGSLNIIYMATNMMLVMGSYYLFEDKCVDLSFLMAFAANWFCFALVGRQFGFPTLINQYIRQIVSLAKEGGLAIQRMEFHDMTYGFGAYCLYYTVRRKKSIIDWAYMVMAWMSFLCAMKKIGILGVFVGCAVAFLYSWMNDKYRKRFVKTVYVLLTVIGLAYVWSIKSKVFLDIVTKLGLETSGRDYIYYTIQDVYEFSPFFMGNGIRFIYNYSTYDKNVWGAIHNVYLELFVEIGFPVFVIWLWMELYGRFKSFSKHAGWGCLAILFGETVYSFITYFTDNTSFQPPINTIYRMCAMVVIIEAMAKQGKAEWTRYVPDKLDEKNLSLMTRLKLSLRFPKRKK